MSYVVWRVKDEGNSCVLMSVEGIEKEYELSEGVSRSADFPSDAFLKMDPEHPKNVRLSDNLINISALPIVSKRLKEFLEGKKLKNVEYLKVRIVNHKGRTASDDYFVVNPVKPQECIDIDQSGPTWSSIATTDIVAVKKLVLNEEKIDPELQIFRTKHFYGPVLVRTALAEEISQNGFTGIRWMALEKFRD